MKQLTSTKLRVLQSLPKCEPVTIRRSNPCQYDYGHKKSWNRFYSIAYSFINRCSAAYEGKPTHQLINALRKGCITKYKHRAFKNCIEDYIRNCLVTNAYKNKRYQENFVNIDGIVTRNTYKRLDLISLWFENRNRTKDEYLYLPYGVLVIRYQGLHYFITAKEILNDPSRLYSHFNIPTQYYLPQILSKEKFKLLYPVKLKQHDLDQYGLVDQFALVKIFTDGDSAMFHPQTGERLISDCESYYFYVSNPIAFIDNLLSNNFKMSQHFHSVLLFYIETEEAAELLVLKPSYHDFGNYSIDIVKNINIL